ncbi:MAG: DivIVA domain-containing protein [Ignavibacteria bacterium]
MKFSPLNIKAQQFTKSIRGYNIDEIHAFLEKLADEFESSNSENDSLKKELDKAKDKLNEYRTIEKKLQDTLQNANESSSKMVVSARKQTSLMIKEAEMKATQIVENAREDANRIRNAVVTLKEERNVIIARIKAMISAQSGLLEMKLENIEKNKNQTKKYTESERHTGKEKLDINIEEIIGKLI